jgi:hypothetical protein
MGTDPPMTHRTESRWPAAAAVVAAIAKSSPSVARGGGVEVGELRPLPPE